MKKSKRASKAPARKKAFFHQKRALKKFTMVRAKKATKHHKVIGLGLRISGESVTLDRDRYAALISYIEDLEDAQTIMHAEHPIEKEYLPADAVNRMIAGEHPLRVWREHRGMSQTELAEKANVQAGYLSEIETGKKPGSARAYQSLAGALGVAIEDILPREEEAA